MNKILSEKYNFQDYNHKGRWTSYWHQIDEVLKLNPGRVLEIGVGNSTTSNYLKSLGVNLITMDIDEKLGSDVKGNILEMPFKDNVFDIILCAEVLEHLPFNDFEKGLAELNRVTKKYVVLSLPHFGPTIKFSFKIPFIMEKKVAFKVLFPKKHKFNCEHYWEIGKRGYPFKKNKGVIEKYFKIQKKFIPFENQYHHFFILEKL